MEIAGAEVAIRRQAEVRRWLTELDRKVEREDFVRGGGVFKMGDAEWATALMVVAEQYAADYSGDFSFMVEMRDALARHGRLTQGQAKGVLNCLRADSQRANRTAATLTVADGRYAIDIEGQLRFFRVRTPEDGRWQGFTFLDEQAGPDTYPVKGQRRSTILTAIAADPDALARYGQELGRCGNCGLELTDEISRAYGIGPVCRANLGIEGAAPAVPGPDDGLTDGERAHDARMMALDDLGDERPSQVGPNCPCGRPVDIEFAPFCRRCADQLDGKGA